MVHRLPDAIVRLCDKTLLLALVAENGPALMQRDISRQIRTYYCPIT